MMKKSELKRRWKDPAFLSKIPFPLDRPPTGNELNNLDLRGVPKLSNGDPLWHFQIYDSTCCNLDLSFGDGALAIYSSDVSNLNCTQFKFDRASSINKSVVRSGIFIHSKFKVSSSDTHYESCDFSDSSFKGGFNEYGFTRCKFINCKFNNARWDNTYFKACTFEDCDFTDFKLKGTFISGFKFKNLMAFDENVTFSDCDIRSICEIS